MYSAQIYKSTIYIHNNSYNIRCAYYVYKWYFSKRFKPHLRDILRTTEMPFLRTSHFILQRCWKKKNVNNVVLSENNKITYATRIAWEYETYIIHYRKLPTLTILLSKVIIDSWFSTDKIIFYVLIGHGNSESVYILLTHKVWYNLKLFFFFF